jgi:2,6-dihydroxypseudooxynicotine hydrolase
MQGPDLFDMLLRVHGAEELGREYVFVRLARMNIAGHLDYSEISRILGGIRRRADWVVVWMGASERHRSLASAAAHRGAFTSAGDAYLRASLCAHWASLYAPEGEVAAAHQSSLELYSLGSAWFEPPAERVEIPFEGDVLPAYVRRGQASAPQPVVVMLGGADTNKEELHHWGTEFARRGFAVVTVDGPGQGELSARYKRLTMRFDHFHEAVSAVIDWLQQGGVDEVDTSGVGVFGNSLGGYLALDAAFRDERIAAVISNGGFCDAASIASWPAGVMRAFASCLGIDDEAEIRRHVEDHLDLVRVPARHRPPALVVHGGREDLASESESRRAAQAAEGTLLVVEDGWHTCTNRDHVISPVFADWTWSALKGNVRSGFSEVRIEDELGYQALFTAVGR